MTILTTERLTLRHLEFSDAVTLHHIHHEAGVWEYFTGSPPTSADGERAHIERQLAFYREHGFGFWATVLRETGELIGRCGLLSQVVDGRAETEIADLLYPRFWGRGLASEAVRSIRDYAFQSLRCSRLVSLIHPDNVASKRVATAAGLAYDRNTRFKYMCVEVYCVERNCS